MRIVNKEKDKDKETLFVLCRIKDFDGIKTFLEQDQNLLNETVYIFEETLLMIACDRGWYEIVEYLLVNYSNTLRVNIKNRYGYTALYYAVEKGRIECIRFLLSHPNIDVTIPCGLFDKPVLWYCGSRECYDLISPYYTTINEYEKKMAWLWSLMSYKTVDVKEVKSITATIPREALQQMKDHVSMMVWFAAEGGQADILEYLLSSYGDIININIQDKYGVTALTRAVQHWQADCVKLLLTFPNINLTVLDQSLVSEALFRSVTDNEPETLKALLDHPNIDVNEMFDSHLMQGTVLCFAVVGGLIDCVKLLLSHRDIDVNINCEEFDKPVLWYCGNRECYDLLLPYYPTLNEFEKKMAWLYSLCLCGKEVVEEVKNLMNDFTLNDLGQMKDDVSMLIMSLVVRGDKGEIIKYLLPIIDINFQNKDGNTVLYQAVRYKEFNIVRFLLAQPNINVNIKTGEFEKPVLWYCGSRECFDLLLPYYTTINEYEKKMAWLWSLLLSEAFDVEKVNNTLGRIPRKALHQMKDDVSCMMILAAEKGKADILEYLLSSYGNIIDINIQDKYGRSSLHRAILNRQRPCQDILLLWNIDETLRDRNGKTANDLEQYGFWMTFRTGMTMFPNIINQLGVKVKIKCIRKTMLKEHEREKQELEPLPFSHSKRRMNKHDFAGDDTMITADSIEVDESMSQYFQTSPSYFRAVDDTNDTENGKREFNRSFKLFGRRNTSPEKVYQMEQTMVIREVRERADVRRTELNHRGMLTWVEENDLEDFILLDPIEQLVKPATSMIDKYLATRGHPYKTIYETQEIHEEGKKEYDEEWMKMMEFGRLSELVLNDIWAGYYPHLSDTGVTIRSNNSIDNDLLMMIRFGLLFVPPITSLDNSGNSNSNNVYYIPSLLPSDSPSGSGGGSNDGSENGGDDSKESKEQKFRAKFNAKNEMPDESWNIGMHYSVFFYLLMDDYPLHKSHCLVYDIISSSELTNNGSLPPGFFERFIDHFKQRLSGFQLNEMINCVRGKATLTFSFLEISFIESRKEKRIEVIFRTHPDADKMKAKIVFQDIYYIIIDVIDDIRKKSNIGGLQVKTLVHPPPEKTASCDFICINATGFITLTTVRQLLSKLTMPDGSSSYEQTSCDSSFIIELNLLRMRRDSYWSVWEEKRSILPSVAGSCSAVPPLPTGKKTHVFLSYDWGIDDNNHNRVKQVSEALKSRGLITWIDDERIVNEIDEKIIDGIDHTECMLVFMTENYAQKLQGRNDKDYCKKEFKYGFEVLGREKMILVVLDEPMRDLSRWPSLVKFHLPSILYFDLSEIFKQSSNTSEDFVKEKMNELYKKITTVLPLEHNQTLDSCTTSKKKKRKLATLSSNRVEMDNDQGVLSSDNNLNREKKKKKEKRMIDDELSSDEDELDHVVSEENNTKKKRKREISDYFNE